MTRLHRQVSLVGAAATLVFVLLGTACSDAPTAPRAGGIQAVVVVAGGEPNDSTYTLTVDSTTKTFSFAGSPPLISGLNTGPHTLTLKVPVENCTVTGSGQVAVTVSGGANAYARFDVECETTGIEVTTRTTGLDIPSTYTVLVTGDSRSPRGAEPNGLLLVSRLRPGTDSVTLTSLSDNCHVVGDNPITVDVVNRAVTPVVFDVHCAVIERPETIAYESDSSSPSTIRLANPDGSGEVDLGSGSAPSWSPDGSKLVFVSWGPPICTPYDGCFPTTNLAVMAPNGLSIQALPVGFSPAWAPSGDVIAFVVNSEIYLTRLDGSEAGKLPIQGIDGAGHPSWSPDGLRIAFECLFAPRSRGVCVVNKDGTGLVRLWITDAPSQFAFWPAWSPDGRTIAVSVATGATQQIAVMPADGSSLRFLAYGSEPAWSRDGSKLVFAGDSGLFQIDADGSNLKRLTTGPHAAPAWRP